MTITYLDYVPVLKWRQGEYQALLRLRPEQKDRIVPLIEVCPPEFDFETRQPEKSLDDHLLKFGPRLKAKWGSRLALVDTGLIDSGARLIGGIHPLTRVFADGRAHDASIVPVTSLDRDDSYQQAVKDIHARDLRGACLRCTLDDAADENLDDNVAILSESLEIDVKDLDIVVDLRAANFEPLDGLAQLVRSIFDNSSVYARARSLTVVGSSFPGSMSDVVGPAQVIPRHEWMLYRALVRATPKTSRIPTFGDYAIASPDLVTGDMRLLKPSASIRYTIDDGWLVIKGPNVRDHGFDQYRAHSRAVCGSSQFLGTGFSAGSAYIERCGAGSESTGNLTTWRWVGTNHHLAKVVSDLSNFYGF